MRRTFMTNLLLLHKPFCLCQYALISAPLQLFIIKDIHIIHCYLKKVHNLSLDNGDHTLLNDPTILDVVVSNEETKCHKHH